MSRGAVAVLIVVAACRPLPPAPMLARHADTTAAPDDALTATLVVGVAGELLGGDGLGMAVRVERQVTAGTAVGGEITGGWAKADPDGDHPRMWLVAARGYGQAFGRERDWLAAHYGLGLARLSTGMVTATGFAGAAVSYPNDYVAPYLQAGLALVVPLAQGARFGITRDDRGSVVVTEVYTYGDVGALGHLGDTGHRLSADLGLAIAWRNDGSLLALSVAGGHRDEP